MSLLNPFTNNGREAVRDAQMEARRSRHNYVDCEQLLLGLLAEGTGAGVRVLKSMGVDLKNARSEVEKIIGRGSDYVFADGPPFSHFTPMAKQALVWASKEASNLGQNRVGSEHITLALLRQDESVATRVLKSLGVEPLEALNKILATIRREVAVPSGFDGSMKDFLKSKDVSVVECFGVDLTKKATNNELDPLIGRTEETDRVIRILSRRKKSNPILIGEPGVGKTAVAEGLAQKIIDGDVPDMLKGKRVISLDLGRLMAGTKYRGELEERITGIVDAVKCAKNIILLIDEIHTIIGAGGGEEGSLDVGNILKPALARGDFQCIGATTLDEYRKYFGKDAALERRFQPVKVDEPSVEETVEILEGLRDKYERHHEVVISDEALVAAAKYSDQYIAERFLPDKAIDLMDEAASLVRFSVPRSKEEPTAEEKELDLKLQGLRKARDEAVLNEDFKRAAQVRDEEREVKAQFNAIMIKNGQNPEVKKDPIVWESDIAKIVSDWKNIPVGSVTESESQDLIRMEETIHSKIIGQNEAVSAVSRAIRRARAGLKDPKRPLASFIFAGPTGVGKTELTKILASCLFGSEKAIVRFDMSEYMEQHSVSKLIGTSPGYVGYQEGGILTEAVRRDPYSIVLFDEIEKAHRNVSNILLQILDDGQLTDAKGRTTDFKSTMIILTSNIGSKIIEQNSGNIDRDLIIERTWDQSASFYSKIKSLVNVELRKYFRPELLNRIDEIVIFKQLIKDEVAQIAEIMLNVVTKRMSQKGIQLEMTRNFKAHLIKEGFDPIYGARPLRRAIMKLLEDRLAEEVLSGSAKEGDCVVFDVGEDNTVEAFITKKF